MKYIITLVLLLSLTLIPFQLMAQETEPSFDNVQFNDEQVLPQEEGESFKAKIIKVIDSDIDEFSGSPYQVLSIEILNGSLEGDEVRVEYGRNFNLTEAQLYEAGDKVVVNKITGIDGDQFFITDRYRVGGIFWVFIAFFILTIIFARKRGFMSIIGLGISLLIIFKYIVPQIIAGANPMLTSLIGAFFIMLFTIYLAHGFNKKTHVALTATLITLILSIFIAQIFVDVSGLLGLGSEEALLLQFDLTGLNLRGLLLGGIIIGVLGVLDDITTAQAAAVYEIRRANNALGFKELYERGVNIGREHITSLVNTLAMAYVGSSLPILILISLNTNTAFWEIINNELVVEEIVRTLVGSSALILAVPITTIIAAYYFSRTKDPLPEIEGSGHHH